MCLKKIFNGEITFHSSFKKSSEKDVLLEVKGLIQIMVKFRAETILRLFLSTNIYLRGTKYQLKTIVLIWKRETYFIQLYNLIIVIRNGKIAWKHRLYLAEFWY